VPADLAVGVSYLDLVPGDPDEIEYQLVPRLIGFGGGMTEAATRLRSLDVGAWQGVASDAFRLVLGDQPARYETAGRSFLRAASALRSYARVLREAQQQARQAIAMFEQAQSQTQAWQRQLEELEAASRAVASRGADSVSAAALAAAKPRVDPGAEGRVNGMRLLGDARAGVDVQARATSAVLAQAERDAPDAPRLLGSVVSGIGEFFGGAWDHSVQIVDDAWDSVTGLLTDPIGWVKDTWDSVYDHVAVWNWGTFLATWKEFGKEFLSWDEWAKNWRRALGKVAVNVLVTVGTVGVGTLVKRFLFRRKGGRGGRDGQDNHPEPRPSGRLRDVVANPEAHLRYTDKPEDLLNRLGGVPEGWRESRLGRGSHAGQGWKLEEVTPDGKITGRQIRWHPGGGRHGPDPYWVFSSSEHGTTKIIGPKYVP
jgi:hypothetical protein